MTWPFREKLALKKWRTQLQIKQHQAVFNALYQDVDGFALSRHARKTRDALEYVYGEILFEPFIALLNIAKPHSQTCFYDLGSGSGKAVIAAAMVFDLKESHGIELFKTLHEAAEHQVQRLQTYTMYQTKAPFIYFKQGDIQTAAFPNATLIFINATAFFGETWQAISKHLEQVAPGTQIISTSKPLKSSQFVTEKICRVEMSFGVVTAYLATRIQTPTTVTEP